MYWHLLHAHCPVVLKCFDENFTDEYVGSLCLPIMGESIYQNGNEVHSLLEAIVELELELWKREKGF